MAATSEVFGADERPDEIDQQQEGGGAAQDEVEHRRLDAVAEGRVRPHQQDAAGAEEGEEQVDHGRSPITGDRNLRGTDIKARYGIEAA
jgi:hypothetical protein